jgi:glucose-6-phosphate 1-dehydrogenase
MQNKPTILVIFGGTGDLARRYLLPAIMELREKELLPSKFELITAGRADYGTLKSRIEEAEARFGNETQKLFHLAVPTQASKEILNFIEANGLIDSRTKLLLEKPFGSNLKTATELVALVSKYFKDEQVYRVDHYLARETTQEISKRRIEDLELEKIWNKEHIKSIEVIASEEMGIEGRINFYEQTGALRDFLQSHLLEIVALVLKRLPKENGKTIPRLRHEALQNLNIVCDITKNECVKRGQYEGYRQEVGNNESMVETFVSVNMVSNDPLWQGVNITLTTGKALKEKSTKVVIKFKNKEDLVFDLANQQGQKVNGYVHVFKSAIENKHHLFTSGDEVLESWRILESIQETWEHGTNDLIIYKKGTDVKLI